MERRLGSEKYILFLQENTGSVSSMQVRKLTPIPGETPFLTSAATCTYVIHIHPLRYTQIK